VVGDEFLGTTETTRGKTQGVSVILLTGTWGAIEAWLEIKDRRFGNRLDLDWPGLVRADVAGESESDNQQDHHNDRSDRVAVGLIQLEHLL